MPRGRGEPADMAAGVERSGPLPEGADERYEGYGVLGVSFGSGDLLALRRFPISSSAGGYTAVWHRSADGRWTFYSDIGSHAGCLRYFGPALHHSVVSPIRIDWANPRGFTVAVDGGRTLFWSVALRSTWTTAMLSKAAQRVPAAWLTRARMLSALGVVARIALRAGRLQLAGRTPDGSRFTASPRSVWDIAASRARLHGRDLGPVIKVKQQVALGEFSIPRRPLLMFGSVTMQRSAPTS